MLEAKRCISMKKESPCLIIAREQSQGRGRYGRIWFAPKGNLYFTYIQPINHPIEEISMIAGLAVAQALRKFIGSKVVLKHPNDILVDEKKISGILIEKNDSFYSIGVGINVASSPLVQFYETTFVHQHNKNVTLGVLLRCFLTCYHALLDKDFTYIQEQCDKLSLCS